MACFVVGSLDNRFTYGYVISRVEESVAMYDALKLFDSMGYLFADDNLRNLCKNQVAVSEQIE